MKRFTQDILNIKRGDADVDKVYKGAVQIFPDDEPSFEEFVLTIGENRLIRKWDLDGNEDTTGNWPIDVGSPAVRICSLDYSFTHQFFMITGHRSNHTVDGVSNIAGYERFDLDGNSILSSGSLANSDSRAISIIDSSGDFFPQALSLIKINKDSTTILVNVARIIGVFFASYTNGNYVGLVGTRSSVPASAALFEIDGTFLYSRDFGAVDSLDCYVDNSGNFYINHNIVSSTTTRKYDSSGTLLWSFNHGVIARGIIADSSDNVYISGNRTSNITHRKLDSSGNLVWSKDHGTQGTFRADKSIDIDSEGNIWFTFQRTSNITHRKHDPDGTLLLSIDHGANSNGVRIIRKNI
jgi:hypothetical protein